MPKAPHWNSEVISPFTTPALRNAIKRHRDGNGPPVFLHAERRGVVA